MVGFFLFAIWTDWYQLARQIWYTSYIFPYVNPEGLIEFSLWLCCDRLLQSRTPSKLSSMFSGTQDKCSLCKKTVYPLEKVNNQIPSHLVRMRVIAFLFNILWQVTVEGEFYHKSCFRCSHGGCFLTPSSYAALDGILYCKPHFTQLFRERGSYSTLNKTASMKKSTAAAPLPDQNSGQEQLATTPEEDPTPGSEPEPGHTQEQS